MFKRASRLAAVALAIAAAGCSGSDGAQGPAGAQGPQGPAGANGTNGTDYTAVLKPEACGGCHAQSGGYHQLGYNKYTDGTAYTLSIDGVQTVGTTSTMTFSIGTGSGPYTNDPNLTWIDQKTWYAVLYNPATRQFTPSFSYSGPAETAPGSGQYTVTAKGVSFAPESAGSIALVYSYIAKNELKTERNGGSVHLYDDVVNVASVFGGTLDYVSAANLSACEKCHGAPYQKHGYRAGKVAGIPDFAACKTCHYDTRKGSDFGWQVLADDPLAYANQGGTVTTAQQTTYAYTANLMNDVHMSHAMEFEYPQSMQNCVTCHEGKLATVLADAQFKLSTCKSCHPMYGPEARNQPQYVEANRAPALQPMMISTVTGANTYHASFAGTPADPQLYTKNTTCSGCHVAGNTMGAPTFAELHNGGYERKIYTAANDGTRYSDVYTASIDAASVTSGSTTAGMVVKVDFKVAKQAGSLDPLALASVTPTVIIGLYGYDTKDFIVAAHVTDSTGKRALEWVYGASHPRFKALKALPRAAGDFQFTVDLSDFKAMTADGTVKRMEIAFLPTLKLADGTVVAINAPSRTFDLTKKAFDDGFTKKAIVDANKCNGCHDALGSSFHSGDRGGNVTVCRLCHETRTAAGHYEQQSRSIDSYVHGIHGMQSGDITSAANNFADPVEKMRYDLKVESHYPMFTLLNCESCHIANTYEVPEQGSSLPGVHSPSANPTGMTRNVTGIPRYVQGPAARACGSCHRAIEINEDNAGALQATNEHFKSNGYLLEDTGTGTGGLVDQVISTIMSMFK
jgi:OmcA/MtrC family decaheme c-type cytochrome